MMRLSVHAVGRIAPPPPPGVSAPPYRMSCSSGQLRTYPELLLQLCIQDDLQPHPSCMDTCSEPQDTRSTEGSTTWGPWGMSSIANSAEHQLLVHVAGAERASRYAMGQCSPLGGTDEGSEGEACRIGSVAHERAYACCAFYAYAKTGSPPH